MSNANAPLTGAIPRARWLRIGVLLFLIYLVAFMDRSNISIAAPSMVKAIGLSSTALGVLLSAFFWGYVVTQVPGGLIAGRFGPKRVIIVTLFIWGICATATGFMPNLESLIGIRFIMGLAEGAVWPSFGVFFANWYPDSERARATNFSEMALPISSFIMAPLGGWLIEISGFRLMFIIQGIPAFIMAILFWWLASDSPETDKRISQAERDYIVAGRLQEETGGSFFREVIGRPITWAFAIVYFLWLVGLYSFGLWLPSLVNDASHLSILIVGSISAIPYVIAAIAMFLVSRQADKANAQHSWFVAIPLGLAGVSLAISPLLGGKLGPSIVLLCVTAIGLYSAFGPWWAWVLKHYSRRHSGTVLGFINLGGNFGGIVGPVIVGWIGRAGHIGSGFAFLGYFLIAAALLVWGIAAVKRVASRNSADGRAAESVAKAGL